MRILYTLLFILFTASCVRAQVFFGPVAICEDIINVSAGQSGCEVVITPDMIDAGSYHTQGSSFWMSTDPTPRGLGTHTATLTVRDWLRTSRCQTTVRVEDKVTPTAICHQWVTVRQQDPTVPTHIAPAAFDAGSWDNCDGDLDFTVYQTSTNTNYFGKNDHRLDVEDDSGNRNSCHTKLNVLSPNMPIDWEECYPYGDHYYEYIRRVELFGIGTNINYWLPHNDGGRWYSAQHPYLPGVSLSLRLTPGYSSSSYPEYWRVSFDRNVDGDFEDAGEELFTGRATGLITGSITLPAITDGMRTSKLRILMSYDPITEDCPENYYGGYVDITMVDGRFFSPSESVAEAPMANLTKSVVDRAASDQPVTPTAAEVRRELARRSGTTMAENDYAFPNPVQSGHGVHVNASRVELLSITGRQLGVWTASAGENFTKVAVPADLAAGTYLLKSDRRTERLVVR